MRSPQSEFLAGARAELPILLGVVPFGMIYGVAAVAAGMPPMAAMAMSSIVFGGSAQMIAASMFAGGVPAAVMVLTVLVVNLRHMLYSASVAPYLERLAAGWKWLLAYLLTDEAYAVTILHYEQPGEVRLKHWYFLGAGLTLWTTWQASTAAGILVRRLVPESWALDFSLPLTFLGLLIPLLRDRAAATAALIAGAVAVLAARLPLHLNLVVAAVVGIVAGLAVEAVSEHART